MNLIKKFKLSLRRRLEKYLVMRNIFNSKKINFKFLLYGQMNKNRKIEMENLIKKQIYEFRKVKRKKFFVLEIGSYLGESLELFGDICENENIDFHIISIDPYKIYNSKKDELSNPMYKFMNNNLKKTYLYFLHNISLTKFREKFIHIRKDSKDGLIFLKNLNLKFDFIYIDGSHHYDNFKNDYNLSKEILVMENEYSGQICGDDYELSLEECHKIGLKTNNFLELLKLNKDRDFLFFEKFGLGFHPGISLFFSEKKDNIIKTSSGFWYLK